MTMKTILVVDDEKSVRDSLKMVLEFESYEVLFAESGPEALRQAATVPVDLVLLDVKMAGMDGLEVLQRIREKNSELPVIMISGFGSAKAAVEAMKSGAYDFVTKPLKIDELIVTVRNALSSRGLVNEVKELRSQLKNRYAFKNMIGNSAKMASVFKVMGNAANSSVTVFIHGESGTGKELVAMAIHYNGERKDKPFVVVNCAAIPETLLESELFGYERGAFTGANEKKIGKFEQADGGTMFLDEVGEMSPLTQAKLLRVIEGKEVERIGGHERLKIDVRIISATNKDLSAEIKGGRFREDLYYRLMVFPITLPPLRERKEDIPLLVSHFIEIFDKNAAKVKSISKEAMELLMNYSWPGNIRELENVIERAVVLCEGDTINLSHLPIGTGSSAVTEGPALSENRLGTSKIVALEEVECEALKRALDIAGRNISKAAKELGIGRATFYRKAKKFGIL